MTVCVGLPIPCKDLNPYGRPFRFLGHGVALVADTRYTIGSTHRDDGLKVVKLSEFAIAGLAGDASVAEKALRSLGDELDSGQIRNPKNVIPIATKLLMNQWKKTRPKRDTLVMIAIYDGRAQCTLYLLSSTEDFKARREDGLVAIGSGAGEFRRVFRDDIRDRSYGWERIRLGRQFYVRNLEELTPEQLLKLPPVSTNTHDVRLNDAELVLYTSLDRTLEETKSKLIGGDVQTLLLTNKGVVSTTKLLKSGDDGGTWQERTPTKPLKSPSEM